MVIKIIRFDYQEVGQKGLRSCKKIFGNCGVDFAKHHRYGVQSVALLCKGLLAHTDCISCEIQPDPGNG